MKRTVKANTNIGARASKRFLDEIQDKYNTITTGKESNYENDVHAVDAEVEFESGAITFFIDENVYSTVLAELQSREEIEITSFEEVAVIKEVSNEVLVEEIKEEVKKDMTVKEFLLNKGLKTWKKGTEGTADYKERIYINDLTVVGIEKVTLNPKAHKKDSMYYDCINNDFTFFTPNSGKETMRELIELIKKEANNN